MGELGAYFIECEMVGVGADPRASGSSRASSLTAF